MQSRIQYKTVTSAEELLQILDLQQRNLFSNISHQEKQQEGFVTVEHSFELLKQMNTVQPHIIAKEGDKLIGYSLNMTKEFANHIPLLTSLFKKLDDLITENSSYIVMGQICIDKSYRRQGVFRGLYEKMRQELHATYDILCTEVATNNKRSLQAHLAIGFSIILSHKTDDIEWNIVKLHLTQN